MKWSDDIPAFDAGEIGLAGGACDGLDEDSLLAEMAMLPHLEGDIRCETDGIDREFLDARKNIAAEHLACLPGPTKAVHMVTSGRYALWDMVPAMLNMARPAVIRELWIATLGFSKDNVASMSALLDAGAIGQLRLLCSHYFKGTSNGAYKLANEELGKRGQRLLSVRTHCKILAAKFSDGRTVTFEASANLRSCKNIEQLTAYGDPRIYDFHVTWIDGLFRLHSK